MFYCPQCKTKINDENVKFCPKCGFDFSKMYDKMKQRFQPERLKNYTLLILIALIIAIMGTVASFLYTQYFIYIICAAIAWYIVLFLSKFIGVVDVVKINPMIKKYLRKMSAIVLLINVLNMITLVKTILALIQK